MAFTQANRLASISTPLGPDKLLFKSMSGAERLGRPFEYELILLSTDHSIDYKSIVGKSVTVTVKNQFQVTRYFNGVIRSFAHVSYSAELSQYVAIMVPQFWFTSLTADCRIFQTKPVKDILSTIIKTDGGVTDYRDSASNTTATREYCVQYRETDFDFASRLMEEEGAYYFFEHKDGKHIFVLSDSAASHSSAMSAAVPFNAGKTELLQRQGFYSWGVRHEAQPGTYVHADYDFKNPNNVLRSNELVSRNHTGSDGEVFDYPGMFEKSADGDRLAKVRIHERQAKHIVYSGETTALALATGTKFKMSDHPMDSYNDPEYLVIGNEITVENSAYRAGEDKERETKIRLRLTAIPVSQAFRPARVTPRPNLRGPHTAVVVGPSGEEVHTDKYGRIKVQFHWDREGKKDENSSAFIRVAQMWAGKGWGTLFIPRIGQEVVVDFLEGEPDRPIVTGCVYNEVNNVPYTLPDNKTRSTIRTNSSTGGGGYNEIRFEDKKDSEQVFLHAQKDQDTRVEHDRKEWIGNDTHLYVKQDRLEKVDRDHHETITGKHVVQVGGDSHLKIKGKNAVEITGKHSFAVKDDVAEKFEKNQSTAVTGDYYIKAKNIVIEAEENITIKVGGVYIAIESGGIKIEAPKIEIKTDEMDHDISGDWKVQAGSAKLNANETKMEGSGIELNASASLKLEGGSTELKGNAQLNASGGMATVKSDGVLTIQGSVVNIN